jgi:putative nucleotidyltransferase with HDIG domain
VPNLRGVVGPILVLRCRLARGDRNRFRRASRTSGSSSSELIGATVDSLFVVCDSIRDAQSVRRQLDGVFKTVSIPVYGLREAGPPGPYTLIGTDLGDLPHISDIRHWLRQKPKGAKVVFITNRTSRRETLQAYAIGATDIVHRPFDGRTLLRKFYGDFAALAGPEGDFSIESSPGVAAAFGTLQEIFAAACLDGRLDPPAIDEAGEAIVRQLETESLASWIEAVRKHHSQTYRHSLLVTGLVVAFGLRLGLSRADLKRLSFAGLLHDVGKCRIPITILEKPGPLDAKEQRIMRQHSLFGEEAIRAIKGLPGDIAATAVQHHEYLDGSGYPYGLKGGEISDLVRALTIADIFAALIELRPYSPPYSGEKAYQILLDMGAQLDQDFVREF